MKNLEFEAFYTKSVPEPFPTFVACKRLQKKDHF